MFEDAIEQLTPLLNEQCLDCTLQEQLLYVVGTAALM